MFAVTKMTLIYFCHQSKCNISSFKADQFDLKHETLLIRRLLNIEIWYIKIQEPQPPRTLKVTRNFEFYIEKYLT